jgi:hypothetical protein
MAMKRTELVNWISREKVTRGSIGEDAALVWSVGTGFLLWLLG